MDKNTRKCIYRIIKQNDKMLNMLNSNNNRVPVYTISGNEDRFSKDISRSLKKLFDDGFIPEPTKKSS